MAVLEAVSIFCHGSSGWRREIYMWTNYSSNAMEEVSQGCRELQKGCQTQGGLLWLNVRNSRSEQRRRAEAGGREPTVRVVVRVVGKIGFTFPSLYCALVWDWLVTSSGYWTTKNMTWDLPWEEHVLGSFSKERSGQLRIYNLWDHFNPEILPYF